MTILYRPGTSRLHRTPPLVKIAGLIVLTGAVMLGHRPWLVVGVGILVALGYLSSGLTGCDLAMQAWPARWVVAAVAGLQWWIAGWRGALLVAGGLLVCLSAANLLTLTTRVIDLMDALLRLLNPLRRIVDPERTALLLALAIRSVPVVTGIVTQAREARLARGQEREWRTLLSAVVIRCLHRADALSEALAARGLDD